MHPPVDMMAPRHVVRNDVQIAVTHTGFGHRGFRKLSDVARISLEQRNFEAVFMIEMNVKR
ncbi:hypothetical protein T281_12050 [Rhodomicrobium udaipurense JA643]|nr:hypothetical protein T281_12050 [Rhodomicrobium udaipurense JA643]